MARRHTLSKAVIGCGIVMVVLAGCAAGRSELDLWVPPVPAMASKQAVTIVEIRDLRPFAVNPGDPTLPSLASQADVENPDKVARTIGRKRNSYGARIGEVTLPEGQTVTGVVRQTVINALQEKGYVVVADASPGILPVSVDIEQFWAWFTPGMLEATLQFESRVRLYGPEVFDLDSTMVQVGARMRTSGATDSAWARVVKHGLDNLAVRIRDEVEPATPRSNLATTTGSNVYSSPSAVSPPTPIVSSPAPAAGSSVPPPAYLASPSSASAPPAPAPLRPCDPSSAGLSLPCDASATDMR